MHLILASASPRRQQLLAEAGVEFEVVVSPAEEIHDASIPLVNLCEQNAELKARAVAEQHPKATVIGADTLVWIEGEPLGKPKSLNESREMLRKLSGRAHTVCTGVCIFDSIDRVNRFHDLTLVRFKEFDESVIEEYIQTVDTLDKAGAYGIQERGDLLVESIEGAFDNVMGLPVSKVIEALRGD
ncbi:Maf family protein [Haloferula sp. BvORR071]|uniref:Maf family protein n=1 Tax=Haloferula sp. BvORR071 TaxID=1396141 RepID=UPI0005501D2E|nr:Maf family protein [Haloferula sp. BvORR071]